jgi:hypothetical protein
VRKGHPIPVSFDLQEEVFIRRYAEQTGLSRGEIIRRAVRFAGPKFLHREVDIADMSLPALAAKGAAGW